jgi:hypothetical protein
MPAYAAVSNINNQRTDTAMLIRTTTDPMTLNDVPSPERHPSLLEGDSENGLKIYFESEATRKEYLNITTHDPLILEGDDSEDYIAEG